jgi:hypothetical protein
MPSHDPQPGDPEAVPRGLLAAPGRRSLPGDVALAVAVCTWLRDAEAALPIWPNARNGKCLTKASLMLGYE